MELCHDVHAYDIIGLHSSVRKKSAYLKCKRVFDIVFASALLLITLPILLIAILLIYIDSPGSIIYKQMRSGQFSKNFLIYKLRTMKADKNEEEIIVTKIGKYLRKFSIDELPQLINVIKGDMSIIGPRPIAQHFIAPDYWMCGYRDLVKPGITGLWQIKARRKLTKLSAMLVYDVEYISNISLKLDLIIALKTIPIVLFGYEEFSE